MDWTNNIITEDSGMADSQTWYSLEELYQAFKQRFLEEAANDD